MTSFSMDLDLGRLKDEDAWRRTATFSWRDGIGYSHAAPVRDIEAVIRGPVWGNNTPCRWLQWIP